MTIPTADPLGTTLWPTGSLDLYPRKVESPRLTASSGLADRESRIRDEIAREYPWVEDIGDGWYAVTFFADDHPGCTPFLSTAFVTGYPQVEPEAVTFQPVDGASLWSLTLRLHGDARFAYQIAHLSALAPDAKLGRAGWFALDEAAELDPFNPRRTPGAFDGDYSVLELPLARPSLWPTAAPRSTHGSIQRDELPAGGFEGPRPVWCYLPEGVSNPRLVVLLDGEMWNERLNISWLLDSLIESGRIEPVCVIMPASVSPDRRIVEMTLNPAYLAFLGDELLPWAATTLGIQAGTGNIIGGWSLGGLTAAYAAMSMPHFDAAISISGSYWWPLGTPFDEGAEALTHRLAADHTIGPVDWYVEVGRGEAIQLAQNRHFADVIRARGHRLRYVEHGGAHDLLGASIGLAEGLVAMLG